MGGEGDGTGGGPAVVGPRRLGGGRRPAGPHRREDQRAHRRAAHAEHVGEAEVDLGQGLDVTLNSLEQLIAKLLMGHFTTAVTQGHFYLVTLFQKTAGITQLYIIVVLFNVRSEF